MASSREEAKATVQRLARKYGYLNDQMMDDIGQWRPEYRRELEENWLALESAAAQSIKTLAKQIYGSGARFVFELLQNADDNRFKGAQKHGMLRSISFEVHPHQIIVECNEDGFSNEDLAAICAVGQSTKSATHGYIGAKGIGFKSVFIAASKVYIQSGYFSFEFRHPKDGTGIGMVRPIWVDTNESLDGPLTRMTLHLHGEGDSVELQHLRDTVFKQFDDLEESCLLFLRKLQSIRVTFYSESGEELRSKSFRRGNTDDYRVSLETTKTEQGKETIETRHYHVTKHMANGLARSDNRDIPDTEEGGRVSSTAEVVLAFPLTEDFKPLELTQKLSLFAFLPVRESDFKFLIHSDFDTSASRQDIVTTSRRNISLLDGIATAFIKAVLQFCEHPSLCYEWPVFLPSLEINFDTFWSSLNHKIETKLEETPILKSRHRNDLRKISEVYLLPVDAIYGEDIPVFDDEALDPFLSSNYSDAAENALEWYGLEEADMSLLVDLLRTDLDQPRSRMRARWMSDEWHSTVAQLFSQCFSWEFSPLDQDLRSFRLIPLREGQWVASTAGPAYFPTTEGITLPQGLDLNIIDPVAMENMDRKEFFSHLGASEAPVEVIRASIMRLYGSSTSPVPRSHSKAHLHYLFLTHQPGSRIRIQLESLRLYDKDNVLACPQTQDMYLPGDHPCGPEALFSETVSAPGFRAKFIHPTYMTGAPAIQNSVNISWDQWLVDFIGVRERLRLVSRDGHTLSDAFLYVFEHRPERFLELFEYLWRYNSSYMEGNKAFRRNIKDLPAGNFLAGPHSPKLSATWLPFQHLQTTVSRYMQDTQQFPFLQLEDAPLTDANGAKWVFLHQNFNVGKDDNMKFLLKILHYIRIQSPGSLPVSQVQKLCDLYLGIAAKLTLLGDQGSQRDEVRNYISNAEAIFVPAQQSRDAAWVGNDDCLWDAPPDMISKPSLKHLYARMLGTEQQQSIEHFFCHFLCVPAATLSDLVAELEELKHEGNEDLDRISGLYTYMSLSPATFPAHRLMRTFEDKRLIFATKNGRGGWYKISECLWSSTTDIRGKATLDDHYEDLNDFFVETLGVRSLTLQMVYDELLHLPQQTSTSELQGIILSFNGLLQTGPTNLNPEPLRDAHVFPVKYPQAGTQLRSADTDFAIGDRKYLTERFKDQIKLLDYDLEDVWRLRPFFEWANLQDRYLSASVKEVTSVSDTSKRPVSMTNRDLKRKAYFILRVAATFNSPRYQEHPENFYQLLRTSRVFETEGIHSMLKISQDNMSFNADETVGNEHISETSGLTIYVPRKKKAQELCFGAALPAKFADWLMRDRITQIRGRVDADAIKALTAVFTCSRSALDQILDHLGIIQVPFPDQDLEDETEDDDDDEDEEGDQDDTWSESQMSSQASSINGGSPQSPGTAVFDFDGSIAEAHAEDVASGQRHRPYYEQLATPQSRSRRSSREGSLTPASQPSRSPAAAGTNGLVGDTGYLSLLNRVVIAARRATFPSRGLFDMSGLRDALTGNSGSNAFESFDGLEVMTRFRSASQLERDKKVGAAGELYVFELLANLGLEDWSRANWQSTIRHYANVHHDYRDMEPWSQRETADIVYNDVQGCLTEILIDHGYLEREEWQDARPKYFIEVKTTSGPCDTPFYMSGGQYTLMQRIHRTSDGCEVYMIMRVFWLNSNRIGVCIYFDPEQLRQDERLVFTGQTWSVVPGRGPGG